MRLSMMVTAALSALSLAASADETRVEIGDPPRTYAHFLNAHEASLCRAGAATGGIESYFLNPACASDVVAVSGQATLRFVATSRDYLSDGEGTLDASDGAVLLSQAVAVRRSGTWVFGFGYSAPSYRNLELSGARADTAGVPEAYEGAFKGALRYFEAVFASAMGQGGRAGIGIAAGLVSLSESVREVQGDALDTAEVTGSAGSIAMGLLYRATDAVMLGAGYRWSSRIDVQGEWYDEQGVSGSSKTQPTTVAGVTVRATPILTFHASYINEGWDAATATLSAYRENDGRRNEFDEAVATAAVGAEGALLGGKLTLRAGGSTRVGDETTHGTVPEWAAGLGGTYQFEGYALDAALVRERYAVDGQGGKISGLRRLPHRFVQLLAGRTMKIAVAMSGGVDGSVAALLLGRAGHDLVGLTMLLGDAQGSRGAPRVGRRSPRGPSASRTA